MNVFTADADFTSILVRLTQPTEIRMATGEILGYFTPAADEAPGAPLSEAELARRYEVARTHFDPQELKRRKASNAIGATTAEIIVRLPRVESEKCDSVRR